MNNLLKVSLTLLVTLSVARPSLGDQDVTAAPIDRETLVPPADLDEHIRTPRGNYRGLRPLGEICIDTGQPAGPLPEDVSGEFFPEGSTRLEDTRELRNWPATVFQWQATDFFHQPLYFGHESLEVYGQSLNRHLQPLLSGARFFATIPVLPIKLAHTPPHVHISTLGQYRPGSPTPCLLQECAR